MKKFIIVLFLFFSLFSCEKPDDGLEEQKRVEEKKMIEDGKNYAKLVMNYEGENNAVDFLKKSMYFYNDVFIYFDDNSSAVKFRFSKLGYSIFAEYDVNISNIIIDFSRIFSYYENWSVKKGLIFYSEYIKELILVLKEKVKEPSLTEDQIKDYENLIEMWENLIPLLSSVEVYENESIKKYKKLFPDLTEKEIKKKLKDDMYRDFYIKQMKVPNSLKTINPIKGVISEDKNTITFETMLLGFEDDEVTPIYGEDVVFSKE